VNELDDYTVGDYFRILNLDNSETRLVVSGIKPDAQYAVQFRLVSIEKAGDFGSAQISAKVHTGTADLLTDAILLGYIPNAVPGIRQFKAGFSDALNWCISSALAKFPEADLITATESLATARKNGVSLRQMRVYNTNGILLPDAYFMGFDPKGDIRVGLMDQKGKHYVTFKPCGDSTDDRFTLARPTPVQQPQKVKL
jgi:hypothetical protein